MIKKEIVIVANTKDADRKIKDVNESLEETDETSQNLTGSLGGVAGGAVAAFGALKKGLITAATGFRTLGGAIALSGIGVLILIIAALRAAFQSSEEGQNKWNKIMMVMSTLVGNFVDLLADLGEKIIWVFENPKKAIKEFSEIIKKNIITRFKGLLGLLPALGKAISQLFKGNFSEAGKIAADAVGKVVLGVESVTDRVKKATEKVKEFSEELVNETKLAAQVADMRAKAEKIDRELLVERAKNMAVIADLRLKARDEENFSVQERKKFLTQSKELMDDLIELEEESLTLKLEATRIENTLARSNKDALNNEARAEAALFQARAKKLNQEKKIAMEILALNNKLKAEKDKELAVLEKEAEAEAMVEEKKQDAIAKIQEKFRLLSEDFEDETELQKIQRKEERALLELDNLNANEQQKFELKKFYDELYAQEQEMRDEQDLEREQLLSDGKKEIAGKISGILLQMVNKDSKAYKGIAIAQSIMNTYKGITSALSAPQILPDPFGSILRFANAAAVGIAGFKNVKKIRATNPTGQGNSASSAPVSSGPGGTSSPSFNLVSGSASNQIAEGLNGINQPVQAFVVSSHITTQQELDRKVLLGASI